MEQKIKGWKQRVEYIYSSFEPELWESGLILDVGSANGKKGLRQYIDRGASPCNCTAIDGKVSEMDILKSLGCNCIGVNLEQVDLLSLGLGVFDIIVCSHLLEHVSERCEGTLLTYFQKTGKNIAICYPRRVKRINSKLFAHKRTPDADKIIEYLKKYFEDVHGEKIENQIAIIAKNNKGL